MPNPIPLYACNDGPQNSFRLSEAEEVLYGGAAGGGKSYALRAFAVRYCLKYPGAVVGLFRRTYGELEDTHINMIQKEVPEAIAHYSSGPHNLLFKNGSMIQFRYCERSDDVIKYDSVEFDALCIDELTHFDQHTYTYLLSRCRSTKSWWPGRRIRCAATPLSIGHAFVKARWIDPAPPNTIWKGPISEGGMTRQFIPAKVTDNPPLMRASPEYMDQLRALSHEEYRAKALGDWEVFTGQFFQRWRDNIHVIAPFEIPPDWDKFMCVDYGFNAPYAVLWFARPPGTDSAFFYREHYGAGVTLKEQVQKAWGAIQDTSEKIKAIVLDPSMFGKVNTKGDRIESMAADWQQMFGSTTNIIRGNNERIPGWRMMREMVDWTEAPDGAVLVPPRLFVFNTCRNLARTLPLLISDKNNVEDIDSDGEDHACFPAGTKVLTSLGERPIEDVKTGDIVLTRYGGFPVSATMSRLADELYEVRTKDNIVQATGNHPFWTKDHWTCVDALRYGIMVACLNRKQLSSMVYHLGGILSHQEENYGTTTPLLEKTSSRELGGFIRKYGRKSLGIFQKATQSIIETETPLTMISPTLNVLREGNISESMEKKEIMGRKSFSTWQKYVLWLLFGMALKREESGIEDMQGSSNLEYSPNGEDVNIAQKTIRQKDLYHDSAPIGVSLHGGGKKELMTSLNPVFSVRISSLPISIKGTSIAHTPVLENRRLPQKMQRVYNLEVSMVHEYIANGFIVSNCDAARYGLRHAFAGGGKMGAAKRYVDTPGGIRVMRT